MLGRQASDKQLYIKKMGEEDLNHRDKLMKKYD